jgi:gliding motility-associated-like protein
LYTIYGKPTQANAGKDTTICSDINLYANTPTVGKGVWSCDKGTLDDATIPSARLTNLTKGDVATCTWTTSNGLCTSTSDGVRITKLEDVTPAQIFIDGKDVSGKTVDVCITGNNTLSANASAAFKTGESGVWTTASGTSVTGVVGSNTNLGNMTKATSGTTVINWEMSSPIASCPKSKAVTTIRVFAEPVANIASISTLDTCQNATPITLSTAAVSITDAGAWTSSLKPAATTANNWFLNGNTMAVGNNVITWEVTSPACPKAVDTETIRIEAMVTPSVSLVGQSTLCFGANPSYVASPTNGGSGATYVFDFDGDGNAATSSQASNSFSVNAIQASGKITVTMTSSLRCVNNRTATANVNQLAVPGPEPMVLTANDTICVTDPISIFGIDNAIVRNNTSYGWYRDGILAQKVVADANGNLTLSNAAVSGTYTIRADNGVCLPIESDSMVLDVRQVPSVNASVNGANPVKGFEGEALYLSGAHTGQSASWDGGVLLNPAIVDVLDMNSVLLTADRGGKYIATLTAVDGPCSASDAVAIQIQQRIKAPNVFTVNGDGVNETFHIIGIETWPFAKVTIFNRWGGKVYESSNYLAEEWNGGEAPAGVYYYVIDRGEDEKKGEGHSGVVHLIR